MSRKFVIDRDPYDEGYIMYNRKNIEINPGVTILIGCNGAGKTTLLYNLKAQLKKDDVPLLYYNNLNDGGSHSVSRHMFEGNISLGALMMMSSEGENIMNNIGSLASKLRKFIVTGDNGDKIERLAKSLHKINNGEEKEEKISNERWILLDAIDSGLSIDHVVYLKDLFKCVLEDELAADKEIYVVASANEYELAADNNCFDVGKGKYVDIKSYDDYKKAILASRKKKDKRYKKED